jgi:hypothetical protein
MLTADQRQQHARLAALRRHHPDDPSTDTLARDFKASRLEEHIMATVDSEPSLSAAQRGRLAVLLRGGDTDA